MTERYTYTYDAWGRPLTVTHQLDALSPVVLHDYAYDAVGRLESDSRNGDADLKTNYEYNVRSWLTDIKVGGNAQQGTLGETFTQTLYYQNTRPTNPQAAVQWSGNVSSMDWMAGSDGVGRRYDFAYDGLSRLTGASYDDDSDGTGIYSRGYAYDRNGNITMLATATDTTQVTYTGNQLTSGNNYTYDANGNMTKDLPRSISSISYNLLNLPQQVEQQVSLRGGIVPFDQEPTFYLYTASGVKLQSITGLAAVLPGHPDTRDRTDYVGNLIYDRTSLKKILIDGGYVEVSGNTKNYRFFVKDHLGNNRLVTDATGTILQTNHYDPYGESLPDGAAVDSGNPYKYSGKEYDDKALAYDFGARHFTTSIPRWTTMDPLAEKYYSISPYAYCAGNPMNLVDPEGMIFTERSQPYVDQYEQAINAEFTKESCKVDELLKKLDQAKNNRQAKRIMKRIERRMTTMSELISAAGELAVLKVSSQVYDVFEASAPVSNQKDSNGDPIPYRGETKYDRVSGNVSVLLYDGGSTACIAHEFKHLYQFEKGETGFSYIKKIGTSLLHDNQDEIEAFSRGRLFGGDKKPSNYFTEGYSLSKRMDPQTPSFLLQAISSSKLIVFRVKGKTYVPSRP